MLFNSENSNAKLTESLMRKIEVCKSTALSLYKDKASGVISAEEYAEMSDGIKAERAVYEKRLEEIRREDERSKTTRNMGELLKGILSFDDIDRNTLLMLVDKIYIGQDKDIEIRFKFDDPKG